ncbi:MAG: enoyl-ACP reductase FabV [Culicoidibacterales bacterium]
MIIKPSIRMNVSFNAHPLGLKQYVDEQIADIKKAPKFTSAKKALIIGGSTGYGLATRLNLAFASDADTISVSFESAPTDKRTGTAGFWNNLYANQAIKAAGLLTEDFIGDAFSDEMKQAVANYIKTTFGGKIDLLVYSLASGRRTDPTTGTTYTSSLKVIGDTFTGNSYDISAQEIIERTLEPATPEEIDHTIKVMGGEDWHLWVEFLLEAGLLAENFKTVTYSYIGPLATSKIYREGTIGAAKAHMEQTAVDLDKLLKTRVHGTAYCAVCRAAVTRASGVIPVFPLYSAALIKVMTNKQIEELPHQHIYRLLHDMMYGTKPEFDASSRLRPDNWEMRADVQQEVDLLLAAVTPKNVNTILDTTSFCRLFFQQNGFGFANVDYDADIPLLDLQKAAPFTFI